MSIEDDRSQEAAAALSSDQNSDLTESRPPEAVTAPASNLRALDTTGGPTADQGGSLQRDASLRNKLSAWLLEFLEPLTVATCILAGATFVLILVTDRGAKNSLIVMNEQTAAVREQTKQTAILVAEQIDAAEKQTQLSISEALKQRILPMLIMETSKNDNEEVTVVDVGIGSAQNIQIYSPGRAPTLEFKVRPFVIPNGGQTVAVNGDTNWLASLKENESRIICVQYQDAAGQWFETWETVNVSASKEIGFSFLCRQQVEIGNCKRPRPLKECETSSLKYR